MGEGRLQIGNEATKLLCGEADEEQLAHRPAGARFGTPHVHEPVQCTMPSHLPAWGLPCPCGEEGEADEADEADNEQLGRQA